MKSSSPTKKAFTLLEMLLALTIFSLLIFVFLEILLITTKKMAEEDFSDTGEEYIIDILEEEFQWAETIFLLPTEETKLRNVHLNFLFFYRVSKTGEYRYVSYYFHQGNLRRWARNYKQENLERALRQMDFSGNIIARNVDHMNGTGFLPGEKAYQLILEMEDGKKIQRTIDLSLKTLEDLKEVER